MDENSIWKKEITFRRKPKPAKTEAREVAPGAPAEARDVAPAAKPEQPTSIWKKEISFRRKPKADAPVRAAFEKIGGGLRNEPARGTHDPTHAHRLELPFDAPLHAPVWAEPAAASARPTGSREPARPPAAPPISSFGPVDVQEDHAERHAAVPAQDRPDAGHAAAAPAPTTAAPTPASLPLPVAPPAAHDRPAPQDQATARMAAVRPERPGPEQEETLVMPRSARRNVDRTADRLAKEQRRRSDRLARSAPDRDASLHKRVIGLKIGASQIAAAEVVNKGGPPRVIRMARMPLEPGIVVGGELRRPDDLAAALKTFFRKNHLPRTGVRLGISNNRIGVRTFEISGIEDERQLANAIRFRAQETLPIPLDEAVLDYRILDQHVDAEGAPVRRVLLVVAHRELVERYAAACRKAGLKLIGIDLEAFALLRALADPATPPAEDTAVVCISIGHDRSTLAVSDGQVCEFTRVLAWGGFSLDTAIARALDLNASEAEAIKRGLSLGEHGPAGGLDATAADQARRAMSGEVQTFAREIVASLRFYQEQSSSLGIAEFLITGGAAACGGLAEELERLIGVPVIVADPLARVRTQRKLRALNGSTGSLAVAVGLGIED